VAKSQVQVDMSAGDVVKTYTLMTTQTHYHPVLNVMDASLIGVKSSKLVIGFPMTLFLFIK